MWDGGEEERGEDGGEGEKGEDEDARRGRRGWHYGGDDNGTNYDGGEDKKGEVTISYSGPEIDLGLGYR